MVLVMSGLDYSLAPIELRERLSFTRAQAGELAARLQKTPGVLGCVLLSTCNRTELYLSCEEGRRLIPGELLCAGVGASYTPFAHAFVTRRQGEAARHLMEVAGGLKSQIWGEDQIISQVKDAIVLAREYGAADPVLETLFRNSAAAGKEIKTKVRLTGVSTSAASRAVEVLSGAVPGGLKGKRALVIGNGEMGRLSAALLREAGCRVTVTLRTYRHGETLVPAGCGVVPYDDRFSNMEGADVVLSATTSPHFTVTAEQLGALQFPPAFLVDLAMPRDIQPEVGEAPGVTLYNVDTLGHGGRRETPAVVSEILEEHMGRFYEWLNYRRCLPAIEDLKTAIGDRVLSSSELLEDLSREELIALAVGRAVDLLTGGLKDKFTPEDLGRCTQKIRVHTAARPGGREKEADHGGKRFPVSAVC